MKFDLLPTNTFDEIQLGAGILSKTFSPETGTLTETDIIGATSGGFSFKDTPEFHDYGEDIDNCPKNTKELTQIKGRDVKGSGSFVTVNANLVKSLAGSADITGNKITPRDEILDTDFQTIWWIGDYSSKNGATKGGFVAIEMTNAYNTGGFSLQSGDDNKGMFAFEYTAFYSLQAHTTVPYNVYVVAGEDEPAA